MFRWLAATFVAVTLAVAGCAAAGHAPQSNVAAALTAAPEDQMNPLCVVLTGENVTDQTVAYKGKLYHVCCAECAATFNKNPEKYVQAFNANPAAYGVK